MSAGGDSRSKKETSSDSEDDAELGALHGKEYSVDILTGAQMSFAYLEHQSLVDFLVADQEYIVSAGRDHGINVWDAIEGTHIRRLVGHTGPVTGLHLHPKGGFITSSSEDGTIRQWFLKRGEELQKIVTENIITCMGAINDILTVVGNHKGYIEVYHLETAELYFTVLAHTDPVDAIAVDGNSICTATFDNPSCAKVWEVSYEKTTCIFRFDETPQIRFGCVAMRDGRIYLGSLTGQKVHVVDIGTGTRSLLDVDRLVGRVHALSIVDKWILISSGCRKDPMLNVYRTEDFNHFGIFHVGMHQALAVTAIESESSLKVVVGGSALAVLSFEFILTQHELENRSLRYRGLKVKRKGLYTLKNAASNQHDKATKPPKFDSESSEDDTARHLSATKLRNDADYKFSLGASHVSPESSDLSFNEYEEMLSRTRKLSVLQEKPEAANVVSMDDNSDRHEDVVTTRFQKCEPRAAIRKLEEMLDREETRKTNADSAEDRILLHREKYQHLERGESTALPSEAMGDEFDKQKSQPLDASKSDSELNAGIEVRNKAKKKQNKTKLRKKRRCQIM